MKCRTVLISFVLFLLASCGGQKGSVNLKVTNSFSTTNSSFNGGLFIHGKKGETGEEFSFALNAQTSVSLELNFGTWEIRAVGWNSTVSGTGALQGDVYCGYRSFEFKDNLTIDLAVTKDQCQSDNFASADFRISGSLVTFKPISVHPCGALYNPAKPLELLTAETLTSDFCKTYPPEYQRTPAAMRVSLNTKLINSTATTGLSGQCIPFPGEAPTLALSVQTSIPDISLITGPPATSGAGGSAGVVIGDGNIVAPTIAGGASVVLPAFKNIPTKIPLTISFYDDQTCEKSSGEYFFSRGLESSISENDFDHVIKGGATPMIAIASPLSKKGTSPFITSAPFLLCQDGAVLGSCLKLQKVSALGVDFHFNHQGIQWIKLPMTIECKDLSFKSDPTKIEHVAADGCFSKDGDANQTYIKIDLKSFEGGSFTLEWLAGANTVSQNFTYNVSGEAWSLKEVVRILGLPPQDPTNPDIRDLLPQEYWSQRDNNKNEGIFFEVAELLSPAMAGGLFFDQTCTGPMSSPEERSVRMFDKENGTTVEKTYQLILNNSPLMIPKYFAGDNPRGTQTSLYDRRMTIREVQPFPLLTKTQMILDFACTERIGRLEKFHLGLDEKGLKASEKHILLWNTSKLHNTRFESYRLRTAWDSGNQITHQSSSFLRGEKFPDPSPNDLKLFETNYDYSRGFYSDPANPGNLMEFQNEHLFGRQHDLKGGIITTKHHGDTNLQNHARGSIFSDSENLEGKKQIRFGMKHSWKAISQAANGNFVYAAAFGNQGAILRLELFKDGSYLTKDFPNSFPNFIASDIKEDGTKAVVVTTQGAGSLDIYNTDTGAWTKKNIAMSAGPCVENTYPELATATLEDSILVVFRSCQGEVFYLTTTYENLNNSNVNLVLTKIEIDPVTRLFTAKTSGKYWLGLITNNGNDHINICSFTNGTVCALQTIDTANSIQEVSFSSNEAKTALLLSYKEMEGNQPKTKYFSIDTGAPVSLRERSANLGNFNSWIGTSNVSLANLYDNTLAEDQVMVPYVRPSMPNFEMNYMSLRPENMTTNVFMNETTFINTTGR